MKRDPREFKSCIKDGKKSKRIEKVLYTVVMYWYAAYPNNKQIELRVPRKRK